MSAQECNIRVKRRYVINRDIYEVDVTYLDWCISQAGNLGLSAADVKTLAS